ncbi:MAG: hypothetical protein LW825_06200, partial [Candidatus Jidaibacter sp.]|nr:hypothetical protein [Candidatus Jidaibacter sp.]
TMSRWSATFTAKILEVFALNYKVLIEAFIHVRVVTPLLLNFNAVALTSAANCVVAPVFKSSCILNTLRSSVPWAPCTLLPEASFRRGLIYLWYGCPELML